MNIACPSPKHNSSPAAKGSRRGAGSLLVLFKLDGNPESPTLRATGRYGWTLLQLFRAGKAGLTTLERPAPRWSHYVFALRKKGVNVETAYEQHAGDFSGTHGRYRLLSPISIVQIVEPEGAGYV